MLQWFLENGSLPLIFFVLVICGLGVPIPEDILLLSAGAVTQQVGGPLIIPIVVCGAGVMIGDIILFNVARRLGPRALERRPFKRILTPPRRKKVREMFDKRGGAAVFIARHIAGLRPAVFAMAGIEGMQLRKFVFWDGLGMLISVPLWVAAGHFGAGQLEEMQKKVSNIQHIVMGVLLVLGLVWAAVYFWRKRNAVPVSEDQLTQDEHANPDNAADELLERSHANPNSEPDGDLAFEANESLPDASTDTAS